MKRPCGLNDSARQLLLAAVVVFVGNAASAMSEAEFDKLYDATNAAYQSGDYLKEEMLARQLLAEAAKLPARDQVRLCYSLLGLIELLRSLHNQDRDKEATPYIDQLIALASPLLNSHNPDDRAMAIPALQGAYQQSGFTQQTIGNLELAAQNFQKAIDLAPSAANTCTAYDGLSNVLTFAGNLRGALTCVEKARALRNLPPLPPEFKSRLLRTHFTYITKPTELSEKLRREFGTQALPATWRLSGIRVATESNKTTTTYAFWNRSASQDIEVSISSPTNTTSLERLARQPRNWLPYMSSLDAVKEKGKLVFAQKDLPFSMGIREFRNERRPLQALVAVSSGRRDITVSGLQLLPYSYNLKATQELLSSFAIDN